MNYLDAFSGIGGFHRGLEEAGFRFDWVGFSEIDKHAKQIYKRRFPGAEDLGDVRTIVSSGRLPGRLDLFTFGFPCQDRHGVIVHSLQPRSPERPSLKNKTSSGGSGPLNRDDGSTYCLDSGNSQAVETVTGIRRLTPLECERLQGFPDGWTAGVSDTQRYRCLGNAVSVPVVRAIGERLKKGWISNGI